MACYAQIDVALADEGGYVARWEEDAVVSCKFFLSKYIVCLDGRWVGEMGNLARAPARVGWLMGENGRIGIGQELDVGTYSAMGWFCDRQTSTRFGRWN